MPFELNAHVQALARTVARRVAICCCQRLGLQKQRDRAEYFSLSHRGSVSPSINAIEESIVSGIGSLSLELGTFTLRGECTDIK